MRRTCLFKEPLEHSWISFIQKGSSLFTQTALHDRYGQRGYPERFTSKETDFKSSFSIQSRMLIRTPPTFLLLRLGLLLRGCGGTARQVPGESRAGTEPAQSFPLSHMSPSDVNAIGTSSKCRTCCSQVLQNQSTPSAYFSWFLKFFYMQKAKITLLIRIVPKSNERMLGLAKYHCLKVI